MQETWLRWADVGPQRAEVRDPRAYLVRIVTRQALNRLRTLARRREDYVGEWLPEPLLTSPDVADDVELAESVSIAMLTVLETLGPTERAVFVLREVFDTPYDEIAEAVGKSPAAVRQIAHRRPRARRRAAPADARSARPSSRRSSTGSSPRSATATCRACSTCSRPTSSSSPTAAAWSPPRRARSRVAERVAAVPRRPGRADRRRRGRRRSWLNGAPGGPDRHRRRARHGGEPRGRGRPDHPHLRRPQPAQAGPPRRRRRRSAADRPGPCRRSVPRWSAWRSRACNRPGSSRARRSATPPSCPRARRPSTSAARTASTPPARSSRTTSPSSPSAPSTTSRPRWRPRAPSLADVVQWTVLIDADADLRAAYGAIAPRLAVDGPPPLVTAARVAGLGVPGALIEVSAIAAVLPEG